MPIPRENAAHNPSRRGGFFIFETIVGLGLLAVAAFVLVVATSKVHLASARMADSRQAVRAAEAALSDLQSGGSPAPPDSDTKISVAQLTGPRAKDGWQWFDVTATVRGQTRTLTGLAPQAHPETAPAGKGVP